MDGQGRCTGATVPKYGGLLEAHRYTIAVECPTAHGDRCGQQPLVAEHPAFFDIEHMHGMLIVEFVEHTRILVSGTGTERSRDHVMGVMLPIVVLFRTA